MLGENVGVVRDVGVVMRIAWRRVRREWFVVRITLLDHMLLDHVLLGVSFSLIVRDRIFGQQLHLRAHTPRSCSLVQSRKTCVCE